MTKVCHVTSVHSSDDARIFHKECVSLAQNGYDVYLVAPGQSRNEEGVHVIGCGNKPKSRIRRMTTYANQIISTALKLDCDIYHLHDPELLLHVIRIKHSRKKIIFDSHEDYFYEKEYLPKLLRRSVSKLYLIYEGYVISNIDGLICCYRKTRERLEAKCSICEMVYNFPLITPELIHNNDSGFAIGYAGGIDTIWNQDKIIDAIDSIENCSFILAGKVNNQDYLESLKCKNGWKKVAFLGVIPFDEVQKRIYSTATIGIALLGYIPECNGKEGNLSNTKLFEIMNAGLPVISTDFILWKDVIEGNHCGICVDPYNIKEIEKAIRYLMEHPEERQQMGRNARNAVVEKYNWSVEERKLLHFYKNVEETAK